MIRKSTLCLDNVNSNKLDTLQLIMEECVRVMNLFISELWKMDVQPKKFVSFKVDTWLSARMQQNLGKQALESVKSQRKRKKKTMPVRKSLSVNFDSRFVDFRFDENSFDFWMRLSSIGNKIQLKLPARKHRHFNKFKDWKMRQSATIRQVNGKWLVDIFFESSKETTKTGSKVLGFDCGYKKLLIDSEGKTYDELGEIYEKISRKEQGSKAFKRSLIERDSLINQTINKIDLSQISEVVVEDLKSVKTGMKTKKKFSKSFRNKLQRWTYPKVLDKLSRVCEERGITFTKVDPTYTSQTCSKCGRIEKSNRSGEKYQCECGLKMDADHNAAINISRMGVYSPRPTDNIVLI